MIDLRPRARSERDPRVKHLDEWQQLSERKREEVLGKNFYEDTKQFYSLTQNIISPRFRPAVQIPELQTLCLREANDLSEFQPQVYIYSRSEQKRNEDVEKGFHAIWDDAAVPYHLLYANIWAQFVGTGFLQWGLDPRARNGKGRLWTKARDPRTVHIDPNADYTCNWSYVMVEDYVHLEEMKMRFPERGKFLPKYPTNSTGDIRGQESQSGFRLPDGPFQSMPAFNNVSGPRGMSSRVRTCFCKDYTREMTPPTMPGEEPGMKWRYPGGRMIVECEGVILADGPNPFPHGQFPIAPIWGTPPLYGIWAVPPTRFTSSLQDLAERTYSQTYENFYRLNNGVWFIPKTSEIKQSDFGGVPGEKQTYAGDKRPELVTPPAFPESSLKMPDLLLQKQRDLQGFTQARQGDSGQGNVSVDLFDASVMRSQGMTQLRGRLQSQSVHMVGTGLCYAMIEYLPDQWIPMKDTNGFSMVEWKKPQENNQEMWLDVGAFHTQSQAIVRKLTGELMQRGVIPVGKGLEILGFPHAEEIGKEAQQQQALSVAAGVVGPGGGGKKH